MGAATTVDVAKLPPVDYEDVVFAFKTTMTKMLIGISKEIGLQYMGVKNVVWDWIIRSSHQRMLAANDGLSFTFQRVKVAEGSVPTWVIFTPERVPETEVIDMATGTERGFFGPNI